VDGDKFKFMPLSLAKSAIRGVELKEERHAPLELPAASDLHYFRLDRAASERRWSQIQTEKTVVVVWTGGMRPDASLDWTDATFTLYMTVPSSPVKP
jgi:predicted component of type VI protein secretion system